MVTSADLRFRCLTCGKSPKVRKNRVVGAALVAARGWRIRHDAFCRIEIYSQYILNEDVEP
jgi:hypothetical protein